MDTVDLKQSGLYINRELSQLAFNRRVLELAQDPAVPLLERLRFLCIASTNLDEFFEIRVAGLKQRLELASAPVATDDLPASEALHAICEEARDIVRHQYQMLNDDLIPALERENIRVLRRSEWSAGHEAWLRRYFEEEVLPVLSPMGLDPAHPFPRILNKSLNFIVSLEGKDAFGRNSGMAVVQAPRSLPRVIQVPSGEKSSGHQFVLLSSIIHAYVQDLFPGMKVAGCYQFRVTRNSDLYVDEEDVDDMLRAVQGELGSRRYGDAVRLEVAAECPEETIAFLLSEFELAPEDLFTVEGPVNLSRLDAVYDMVDRPELKYPPITPGIPKAFAGGKDICDVLRERDVLLSHPYESFAPVLDFLRQAAADPKVLAIKQTLYRTGPDSPVVDALLAAAHAGKEVTVVIELRARFDEADNIALANRLQEAGAHVVYGIVGYKTHAKMILVVRREGRHLRRYVHLGTGNYHPRTARFYTDYGLFTADQDVGEDVNRIFLQLTSLGKLHKLSRLKQSPFTLHTDIIELIDRERKNAQDGKPARIIAKLNALTEPSVIQALYRASMAGVKVDLIVRGVCCLRPGIPGVSEHIKVRSILGRFLEHTRIYCFHNNGKRELYCASADWMERNFFRRVEVCFPILQKKLRDRLLVDLKRYIKDNTAWQLHSDGRYRRHHVKGKKVHSAQQEALEQYT
ncbi:MAG TPA: polyphosphate kinase 1 [Gammaproteobacteria bacterium]|nr:polyphosphate kinase 1 [Gammaproteobacteria bacterium]